MTRNPFTKVAAYGKLRRALAERALEKRAQVETSIAPRDKAMRSGIDLLSRDFRTWLLRRRIRKLEQQTAPKGLTDATRNTWLARGAVAAPFIGGAAYAASRDGGGRNAMPGYQQPYVYG